MNSLENILYLYTLNSFSGWKGLKKFIPRDSLNSPLIYILFSMFGTLSILYNRVPSSQMPQIIHFLFCWIFRKSNKHETRKLCNVHCTLYTFDSICWFEINHLLFYIIISNTLQTHIFLSLHFWKFKLWHFDLEELTFCNIKVVKPKH